MRISADISSPPEPEQTPASLPRTEPARPMSETYGAARRHHATSADFLRRMGETLPASVSSAVGPHQTPLSALAGALCAAVEDSHPRDKVTGLLPAVWYDHLSDPDAEITVRHAWPFTAEGCRVAAAKMALHAKDGSLQQLYLRLEGTPLDMTLMESQFGKARVELAHSDGGPGDVLLCFARPWGRLGVVTDPAVTTARALVLESAPGAARPR